MHFLVILLFLQGSLIYSEVWCLNHTTLTSLRTSNKFCLFTLLYYFRTFIHYECSDRLSGHHETICRICSVGVSLVRILQLNFIISSPWDISCMTIMWFCRSISRGPTVDAHWIHDSPIHSEVESKLRKLLVELGSIQKILGIQVGKTLFSPFGLQAAFVRSFDICLKVAMFIVGMCI